MDFDRMLRYCAELELNNNREWFHAHHDFYLEAKADFTELVELLKYRVANAVPPDLAEALLFTPPKNMMFRIPRDARVWKNKPPYEPSWRACITTNKNALLPVGYFVTIAPGGRSHFGTGAWCPDRETLFQVRNYIADNFDRFLDAVEKSGLEIWGDSLKRVPQDFDPGAPWARYVKFKEWFITVSFPDAKLTSFDAFERAVDGCIERMEPFRRFCSDAISGVRRGLWDE